MHAAFKLWIERKYGGSAVAYFERKVLPESGEPECEPWIRSCTVIKSGGLSLAHVKSSTNVQLHKNDPSVSTQSQHVCAFCCRDEFPSIFPSQRRHFAVTGAKTEHGGAVGARRNGPRNGSVVGRDSFPVGNRLQLITLKDQFCLILVG